MTLSVIKKQPYFPDQNALPKGTHKGRKKFKTFSKKTEKDILTPKGVNKDVTETVKQLAVEILNNGREFNPEKFLKVICNNHSQEEGKFLKFDNNQRPTKLYIDSMYWFREKSININDVCTLMHSDTCEFLWKYREATENKGKAPENWLVLTRKGPKSAICRLKKIEFSKPPENKIQVGLRPLYQSKTPRIKRGVDYLLPYDISNYANWEAKKKEILHDVLAKKIPSVLLDIIHKYAIEVPEDFKLKSDSPEKSE